MSAKRAWLAGLGLFALSGLAYADSVDYNTPGDLTTKFKLNNQTGTGGFTQIANGGIGDSGAVNITAGPSGTQDVTAVYNVKSYNLDNGSIRLSQAVKVLSQYSNGDRLLQLGLIDDTATGRQLNGGAPALGDFISARVFPTAGPSGTTGPFVWQVQAGQATGAGNTATSNNAQSAAFNLTLGDWYQLTVDITKSGTANTFSVAGSLQDLGPTGLTPGTTLTFGPETSSNANTLDLYTDATVFGAFRGHASTGGADTYDNFSIIQVPEPGSFALLGSASIALSIRRKRK